MTKGATLKKVADSKDSSSSDSLLNELETIEKQIDAAAKADPSEDAAPAKAPAAKSASAKSKKGNKAQKSGKEDSEWLSRLEQRARTALALFKEVLSSLLSRDRPTRWMAAFFLASFVGVFIAGGLGIRRYQAIKRARQHQLSGVEQTSKQINEFLKKQADDANYRASILPLGTFTIELKPLGNGQRLTAGILNMAEVDLLIGCDSKETRDFVETNLIRARNEVAGTMTAMDREELMSKDGKRRLKKVILDRLNLWLPKGKVVDVFITRFLIS